MRIRLERLRIEDNDAPKSLDLFLVYFDWYYRYADDLAPISVEEGGADSVGRLYIIRDGRHRFAAAMLAGRKDILAEYKEEQWTDSKSPSVPTSQAQAPSQSLPPGHYL